MRYVPFLEKTTVTMDLRDAVTILDRNLFHVLLFEDQRTVTVLPLAMFDTVTVRRSPRAVIKVVGVRVITGVVVGVCGTELGGTVTTGTGARGVPYASKSEAPIPRSTPCSGTVPAIKSP